MMTLKPILIAVLVCCFSISGSSFCGFYVAKADAKLFNKTSQVILVRDRNKMTVTMSNDFEGDVKDFAMVVPVPTILGRNDIRVVPASLFNTLDAYSGPRLVEYYDNNPCFEHAQNESFRNKDVMLDYMPTMTLKSSKFRRDLGVKIEAQYQVEEYDIVILSAKESSGLKVWLIENGYKIPVTAEQVLEPYIKNDMKFFVVKVNAEKLDEINGITKVKKYVDDLALEKARKLRPLQITYESDKFMLPIRLGMANAKGDQDMIVYALTRNGRVECTNYRTTKIPTDKNIPLFVRNKFGKFYVDLFEKAHAKEDKEAIFLEYAWNVSPQFAGVKCDPCVGPPPIFADLKRAGVDWAVNGSNQASGDVFFTRLHVRYSRETHPQDLQFHVTPNKAHFQARYILSNPATGDLSCDAGQKYCAHIVKTRANELEQLKELTSWNTSQYKSYVGAYFEKLDDPTLLFDVEDDENRNNTPPLVPKDHNDPSGGLKIALLSAILLSMVIVFLSQREKLRLLKN